MSIGVGHRYLNVFNLRKDCYRANHNIKTPYYYHSLYFI